MTVTPGDLPGRPGSEVGQAGSQAWGGVTRGLSPGPSFPECPEVCPHLGLAAPGPLLGGGLPALAPPRHLPHRPLPRPTPPQGAHTGVSTLGFIGEKLQ